MQLHSYNKYIKAGFLYAALFLTACNGSGATSSANPTPTPSPTLSPGSYMTVAVTANLNSATCGYFNAPCVSVTVCNPNSPNFCATIDNVLLDTGSTGLRVFQSLLGNINLPIEMIGSNQMAQCVRYGDGSANWGPIAYANIQLAANAIAESVPMQIINSSYQGVGNCTGAESSSTPAQFGINGILGVAPVVYDDGHYYSCNNTSCTAYNPITTQETANPIALLSNSAYNNGLTLKFPAISSNGASGVTAQAIFGVGTNSSNAVGSGVNEYPSTGSGSLAIGMNTQFEGSTLTGFLDTGSNFLYFDSDSVTGCTGIYSGFYCPSSNLSLTAQNQGTNGYILTNFSVGNASTLVNTGNSAFANLAASIIGAPYFDYGLPFFFGRVVYIGFEGKSSSIGSGPYWAF